MNKPEILKLLQKKIDADEEAGLNDWGGNYEHGEIPPDSDKKYWEKW